MNKELLCELNGSYRLCIRRLLLPRAEKVWEGGAAGRGVGSRRGRIAGIVRLGAGAL